MVVAGRGQLECEGQLTEATAGTQLFIPVGAVHRASATDHALVIVEVQRGDLLEESDIERLADDYGRMEQC